MVGAGFVLAASDYSLSPKGLLGIFVPRMDPHFSPLIGVAAAVLALAGLVRYWTENPVRYLTGLAMFGAMVALGSHTPLHRILYEYVPMVDKARVPAQAMALFHLGANCSWSRTGWMQYRAGAPWRSLSYSR